MPSRTCSRSAFLQTQPCKHRSTTACNQDPTPGHPQTPQVCGNPNLDFAALERNAKYEGGFSAASTAVQWLWGIVRDELSFDEKKMYLKFFTGSDRCGRAGPIYVTVMPQCCHGDVSNGYLLRNGTAQSLDRCSGPRKPRKCLVLGRCFVVDRQVSVCPAQSRAWQQLRRVNQKRVDPRSGNIGARAGTCRFPRPLHARANPVPLSCPPLPTQGPPSAAWAASSASSSATAPTRRSCPPPTPASTRCCCRSTRQERRWPTACGSPYSTRRASALSRPGARASPRRGGAARAEAPPGARRGVVEAAQAARVVRRNPVCKRSCAGPPARAQAPAPLVGAASPLTRVDTRATRSLYARQAPSAEGGCRGNTPATHQIVAGVGPCRLTQRPRARWRARAGAWPRTRQGHS
jgi:hypothetical protein